MWNTAATSLILKEKTVYPNTKFSLIIKEKNCVPPHKIFPYIKGKNCVPPTQNHIKISAVFHITQAQFFPLI